MGEFAQGFVRGFAGTLATDIQTRRTEARDYFNKQVDIARTTGLENRQRVRQAVDSSTRIAKQLQQTGVPKDIIMSIASSNPEELSSFSEQVARAQAAGINIDENFFRDFVEVSSDFKAPDEDFGTFFSRVYEPMAANAASDPSAFNNDPKGSIWASMMGLNAMEKAEAKLGQTQIADGMTAADLLAYKDTPTPNTQGGPTITYNYDILADMEREAKGSELTISERNAINSRIEDLKPKATVQAQNELGLDTSDPNAAAEIEKRANEILYETLGGEYEGVPGVATFLSRRLAIAPPTQEEGTISPVDATGEPTEALSDAEGSGDMVAPETAPVDPVQAAPIDPNQEPELSMLVDPESGLQLSFVKDNGDGTSTYRDNSQAVARGGAAGQDYVIPNHIARQYGSK